MQKKKNCKSYTDFEKTNSMNSAKLNLKKDFCQSYKIFRQIWILYVQIRNNSKNIVFITCKWSKICQYYVNDMVILCQNERRKNTHGLNIWFTVFCPNFKLLLIYAFFPAKYVFPKFRVYKKKCFFPSLDSYIVCIV